MYLYKYEKPYYVLCEDGVETWRGKEVAVAFSYHPNEAVLYKHGDPELVEKWYREILRRFRLVANQFIKFSTFEEEVKFWQDELESIKLIRGKFPVDELNKCLSISGYIGRFYERLQD